LAFGGAAGAGGGSGGRFGGRFGGGSGGGSGGGFGGPPGAGAGVVPGGNGAAAGSSGVQGLFTPGAGASGSGARGGGGFGGAGGFGGDSAGLQSAITYADAHGGGAIGVESQSSAASAILSSDADVAGLGGFSGRESSVAASWIAMEVRDGRLRWILSGGGQGGGLPGDTRQGSAAAFAVVAKACTAVQLSSASSSGGTLYDCQGKASAILAAAGGS
jgi:hypothetical protein